MVKIDTQILRHLAECGVVAIGRELHLLSVGGTLVLQMPCDLWHVIPQDGEVLEKGKHWSCGIDELLTMYYREVLPPGGSFWVAAEKIAGFIDVLSVHSVAEKLHEMAAQAAAGQGENNCRVILVYLGQPTPPPLPEWLKLLMSLCEEE